MDMVKVVLAEHVPELAQDLTNRLSEARCVVTRCTTGRQALQAMRLMDPDVLIVSYVLPDMQGLEVCRQARRISDAGIILITESDDEVDTIVGLELGADDSVRRPYSTRELVARVRAVLRRTGGPRPVLQGRKLQAAGVELDQARYEVRVDGRLVRLSPTEYRLLTVLMEQPGRVVRTEELAAAIGAANDPDQKAKVWVYIRRLRSKIERDVERPTRLRTVRGEGYCLGGEDELEERRNRIGSA